MDGKTAHGSHSRSHGLSAIHLVSAFVCDHGLTLGQWKTEEKSNEITALSELIEALDLKGATVTLDAMGCQKEVAHLLVDKSADYVLGLKGIPVMNPAERAAFSSARSDDRPSCEWVMPAAIARKTYARACKALLPGMPNCLDVSVPIPTKASNVASLPFTARAYLVHYEFRPNPIY